MTADANRHWPNRCKGVDSPVFRHKKSQRDHHGDAEDAVAKGEFELLGHLAELLEKGAIRELFGCGSPAVMRI